MIKFIPMNISKKFFLTSLALSAMTVWAQGTPAPEAQAPQNPPAQEVLQSMDTPTAEVAAPIASSDTSGLFSPVPNEPVPATANVEPPVNADASAPVIEASANTEPVPVPMPMDENEDNADGILFVPTDSAVATQEPQPAEISPVVQAAEPENPQMGDDPWGTVLVEAPAEQQADTAVNPVTPSPVTEAHVLDVLHGRAYNNVGNEAAAPTVAGEISIPHKMHNRKFAYVEPVDTYGVVSFGEGSTFFLAFDNGQANVANYDELGLITLGFATQYFGIALDAATAKSWNYIDDDNDSSSTTYKMTSPGTQYGGTISAKLGNIDLALGATYANPNGTYFASGNGEEKERDEWGLAGKLTVANSASKSLAWAVNLNILRYKGSTTQKTETIFTEDGNTYKATRKSVETDTTSRLEITPEFNIGGAVLQNQKARVYLGLNTAVPLVAYDRINGIVSRHNEYGVTLTPNILAEVALGQYAMAFGSVNYRWDVAYYRDSYIQNVSVKALQMEAGTTTAILGMRLQYEFAALEMAFTKQFLQNPFGSFSDHDEIAMSIGAFVNF